ncbi:extracellular solute-binding protein [bacterium]|nr:extracellular solute-binding protein [bacterium]
MNRKIFTIIFITFLIITGIFFIFKKTPSNNEVVFWTLQMSDFAPYINGVISDFEKENPDIKIKWVDVPFSEGEKRTLASVLSDNPPDLVNLNPDFSATLAHKGALWEIQKSELSQFNEEILKSLETDGKMFSIPWYATSAITIYNRDLISSVPKTYRQLSEIAPQIRKKGAYITLPNITENDTMLKILNKYPKEKKQYVYTLFKNLYSNDLIPKETVTMTLSEALEKYMSENIALIGAGANFLNMIKENAPQTYSKTDVAEQIKGDLGQNDFSLMNFVIPLRAKHKKQALKFALFLTNDKNQLELAKLTNVLAVNKQTLNNDFYKKYDKNDLMAKARVISAGQLNKLQPVFRTQKNQKEVNNLVNNAVQNILLNKGETEKILKELDNNIKLLEK